MDINKNVESSSETVISCEGYWDNGHVTFVESSRETVSNGGVLWPLSM